MDLDFIIVYEDKRATTVDELLIAVPTNAVNEESERMAMALQKQKDRNRLFKKRFLRNLAKLGLVMETVRLRERNRENFFRKKICFVFLSGCSRK